MKEMMQKKTLKSKMISQLFNNYEMVFSCPNFYWAFFPPRLRSECIYFATVTVCRMAVALPVFHTLAQMTEKTSCKIRSLGIIF